MSENNAGGQRYIVVLIRGVIGTSPHQRMTLTQLRLFQRNHCTIIPKNACMDGMLARVKDFVTWGELSEELFQELVIKRGEEYTGKTKDEKKDMKNRFIMVNSKPFKPVFRLNSPRGGFERKGVRRSVPQGGALGYRGEDINKLVKKMM